MNEIRQIEDDHAVFRGHPMIASDGDKVGKVTDVIYDDASNEPRLLVVNPGVLKPSHFVPLRGAALDPDGVVVVPFDRDLIKTSPRASGDHVASRHLIEEIEEHYGLARS